MIDNTYKECDICNISKMNEKVSTIIHMIIFNG